MKSAKRAPGIAIHPGSFEPIQVNAEAVAPYAPRIARALGVLLGAVSLHIWGMPHLIRSRCRSRRLRRG